MLLINGAYVPCGKCTACRISRTREWSLRILHELSYWDNSCFVTLTYDNEHLPDQLVKKDLQDFFKRLRKSKNIKYFACGEYGDQFGRPHYHAIIFGLSINDDCVHLIKTVNGKNYYSIDSWYKGYVDIGGVTYNSARYVAGYIQKKYSGKLAKEVYGEKLAPFQLQSQGIGKRYINDNEKQMCDKLFITHNGQKHSLPRYYRKILGDKISEELLLMQRVAKVNELDEAYEARAMDWRSVVEHRMALPRQRESEVNSRVERWKKRNF
nr:MAG: replication initiator protein [Microviridae sp.]